MKHIHFIGIGGISMSSLACIYRSKGYTVSGSDLRASAVTRSLEESGISVVIGQCAENITDDIDLVVFTAAVHEDNPELIAARSCVRRVIERSVLLGELMAMFEHSVGVAGTHGKTSTSTMLSYIYLAAGLDPTISIGGILENLKSNYRIGHSPYFIAEACEYSDSFLEFHPETGVILNVEAEHLDYFGTYERMVQSFQRYAAGFKEGGNLIVNLQYAPLFSEYSGHMFTVSLDDPQADVYAAGLVSHPQELSSTFDLMYRGQDLGTITVHVPGKHIVFDALAACAASLAAGVPFDAIREGLGAYRSPKKRFEFKGIFQGVTVIDDYAHHPSEITATLKAAREIAPRELYVAFQPHTYSRTRSFFSDFIEALSAADHVVLADIYAAREADPGDIHSADLAKALAERGVDAVYLPSFEAIEEYLQKKCCPQDMLITMGAGDIVKVAEKLLS